MSLIHANTLFNEKRNTLFIIILNVIVPCKENNYINFLRIFKISTSAVYFLFRCCYGFGTYDRCLSVVPVSNFDVSHKHLDIFNVHQKNIYLKQLSLRSV